MAYQPHYRTVFRGAIVTTEIWTCSLAWVTNQIEDPGTIQAVTEGFFTALADWVDDTNTNGGLFSPVVNLGRTDTYRIGSDGKATEQWQFVPTSPVAGTGSLQIPPQCAVVISLRTGLPGRARRGRLYLPLLGVTPGIGDGLMPTAEQTAVANRAQVFLNALNALASTRVSLVVASGVGSGQNTPITNLVLGRVIDTQRRRRSGLVESPITRALS